MVWSFSVLSLPELAFLGIPHRDDMKTGMPEEICIGDEYNISTRFACSRQSGARYPKVLREKVSEVANGPRDLCPVAKGRECECGMLVDMDQDRYP